MPNRTGLWGALGTPKAVRAITVLMVVYAIVIGALVVGYANVSSCIAAYSDESAISSRVRVEAGAQDRTLNNRAAAVDTSDRQRIIANQRATRELITEILEGESQTASDAALNRYNAIADESLRIYAENERERMAISAERIRVDAARSQAPVPRPPSETC